MQTPEISVVISVCNAESQLSETLQSIRAQTFQSFEVICVDCGSTDSTLEVLEGVARQDSRFSVMPQRQESGVAAARNYGLRSATGVYTLFLDETVVCQPTMLEKLWKAAEQAQADVAVCPFIRLERNGKTSEKDGIVRGWLAEGTSVFSYRDCPHRILNIWNPEPWNKLYRRDFLRKYQIGYEEVSSQYDTVFSAVSAAAAERIVSVPEYLVQYQVEKTKTGPSKEERMRNLPIAISSVSRQAGALPHSDFIEIGICYFVIQGYLWAIKNWIEDFNTPAAEDLYTKAHHAFQDPRFESLTPKRLQNHVFYWEFFTVKKQDYRKMKALRSRKIIVSLTSFPARIGLVARTLAPIFAQTHPADKVLLWLAPSQFPEKEADLPQNLLQLVADGKLEIRWGRNLMPHMKYFYTMQEFPEDVVVTIDDDIIYPKDMLEKLYKSYLMYPEAVSAMRAHLILWDENNRIRPYNQWIMETYGCIHKPSMQLFATGVGGVLYPPKLFDPIFFDEEVIVKTCLRADDLWLKAMEAISDVPVVVADQAEILECFPGSQETALSSSNVDQNQNDVQLGNIIQWLDSTFEPGIFQKKLTMTEKGVRILGMEAVTTHLATERKELRSMLHKEKKNGIREKNQLLERQKFLETQMNQERQRLIEQQRLQENQFLQEKQELQEEQQLLHRQLSENQQLLKQQQLLREQYCSEKQQLLSKVNVLEEAQKQPQVLLNCLMKVWKGRATYFLAWLPCRYLGFLQCVQDHGFLYTIRHGLAKLGRRVLGRKQKS